MLAIDVLCRVKRDFPDALLSMVGPVKDKQLFASVVEHIKFLGLEDSVKIVGPVPKYEIPRILDEHDIFLNTTNYESFGVAVMEAAASGLPVVTTDAGELEYMWGNGVDAMVSPVNDCKSMADGVLALLRSPDLANQITMNAREKAETFSWGHVVPMWIQLFETLKNN